MSSHALMGLFLRGLDCKNQKDLETQRGAMNMVYFCTLVCSYVCAVVLLLSYSCTSILLKREVAQHENCCTLVRAVQLFFDGGTLHSRK